MVSASVSQCSSSAGAKVAGSAAAHRVHRCGIHVSICFGAFSRLLQAFVQQGWHVAGSEPDRPQCRFLQPGPRMALCARDMGCVS